MMKQGSGRVGAGAGLEPGQGSAGAGKKQGRSWSREGREQRWGMEQVNDFAIGRFFLVGLVGQKSHGFLWVILCLILPNINRHNKFHQNRMNTEVNNFHY